MLHPFYYHVKAYIVYFSPFFAFYTDNVMRQSIHKNRTTKVGPQHQDYRQEGLRCLARIIARFHDNQHRRLGINTDKSEMTGKKILVGRPRLSVDFAIVLRLRDIDNLGWSRMAEAYREISGQYMSRDTMKRRYLEAKAQEVTTANSTD